MYSSLSKKPYGQDKGNEQFFHASEARQKQLENNVNKYCAKVNRSKLLDVCRTRWVARIDGMALFVSLFQSFLHWKQ